MVNCIYHENIEKKNTLLNEIQTQIKFSVAL